MDYLFSVVIVALVAAFGLCLFYKLSIIEYFQTKGSKLISEWAKCIFCQSFWACFAVSLFLLIVPNDIVTFNFVSLFIPILATPITRVLIE